MAIVVNLFAGPGAGKSTTCAGVFSLLKLHGVECEMVTEYAKDMVWEDRKFIFKNQLYILGKQYNRFLRLKDKVDIIVTDSPIFLSAIYGDGEVNAFKDLVYSKFSEFLNINYYIQRVKPYHQIGRNQTEVEAKDLDDIVKEKIDAYRMTYKMVPGDLNGINIITNDILSNIHINLKPQFKIIKEDV
jgi:hypothetical protein